MDRKETLDAAARCVLSDRNAAYGGPEDNFRETAALWKPLFQRVVIGAGGDPGAVTVEPWMVAWAMNQLKAARLLQTPAHADSWVDMAGYSACGAECATKPRLQPPDIEDRLGDVVAINGSQAARAGFRLGMDPHATADTG